MKVLAAAGALVGIVGSAGAQVPVPPPEADSVVAVTGIVRDSVSGMPLAGARVRLVKEDRGTLADTSGRFVFEDLPPGQHLFSVQHYGYQERLLMLAAKTAHQEPHDVLLRPMPATLEGFEVIADRLATMESRLRARRNAVPVAVRTMDQERLFHSAATDMHHFLRTEAFIQMVSCPSGSAYEWCVLRRGGRMEADVYIDEVRTIGGLDQLQDYLPQDFYLVEAYGGGLQIRAYTHHFMDRMARRPMALLPVFWR